MELRKLMKNIRKCSIRDEDRNLPKEENALHVREQDIAIVKDTIEKSGLFDKEYYLATYRDNVKNEPDLIEHYIREGAIAGYNPSALFDTRYYISQVEGLIESGLNPLYHYILYGIAEHRAAMPPDNRDKEITFIQIRDVIEQSGLFDKEFYRAMYWQEVENEPDLVLHYIREGAAKGYDPSPEFDTLFYVSSDEGLQNTGLNPLYHYVMYGIGEYRSTVPPDGDIVVSETCSYTRLTDAMYKDKWRRLCSAYVTRKHIYSILNDCLELKGHRKGDLIEQISDNAKRGLEFKSAVVLNLVVPNRNRGDQLEQQIEQCSYPLTIRVIHDIREASDDQYLLWMVGNQTDDEIEKVLETAVYLTAEDLQLIVLKNGKEEMVRAESGYDCVRTWTPDRIAGYVGKSRIVQKLVEDQDHFLDIVNDFCGGTVLIAEIPDFGNGESILPVCFPNPRKRLLISLYGFYYGGGEIMPIRLANQLAEMGYPVIVHALKTEKQEKKVRDMLMPEIPVIYSQDEKEMTYLLRRYGVGVISTHHQATQSFIARIMKGNPNLAIRHVATTHGMYEAFNEEDLRYILNQLNGGVDYWTYVAEKNIEPFKRMGIYDSKRFIKIPNGFRKPAINEIRRSSLGISEKAFLFCVASRAIEQKGWKESIAAIGVARKNTGKDICLLLLGAGPVYDELSRTVQPEYVRLLGFRENVCDYMAISDAMLLASWYESESAPLSVIEALQCGLPVIASDVGDIRQMLEDTEGTAGIVFELSNGRVPENKLIDCIELLVTNRKLYESCRRKAKEKAKAFDLETVTRKYLEVFQ